MPQCLLLALRVLFCGMDCRPFWVGSVGGGEDDWFLNGSSHVSMELLDAMWCWHGVAANHARVSVYQRVVGASLLPMWRDVPPGFFCNFVLLGSFFLLLGSFFLLGCHSLA